MSKSEFQKWWINRNSMSRISVPIKGIPLIFVRPSAQDAFIQIVLSCRHAALEVFIHPSVRYPSVGPSVRPSIHPSIHPSIPPLVRHAQVENAKNVHL